MRVSWSTRRVHYDCAHQAGRNSSRWHSDTYTTGNSQQSPEPGNHIDYSPLFPPSGREVYEWYLKAKQRTIDAKFDSFTDFHVFSRHVTGIELIIYTDEEAKRVDQLMRHVVHDAAEMSYTAYRTHLDYMDEVASHFNFNGGALDISLRSSRILSPGNLGFGRPRERA